MIDPRPEARRHSPGLDFRIVALAISVAFAAGCGHAPRPRPEVPIDTTRTTVKAAPARRTAGTRNGASVSGAITGSSTAPSAVVPRLSVEESERLARATGAAVETAQKAIAAVDVKKLDVEQNRKFLIAKDFLAQAVEARTRREYERAQGLALKARLLAEELVSR